MQRFTTLVVAALAGLMAIAAQAAPIMLGTTLTGAAEDPPNASPGTGIAFVVLDADAHTLAIHVEFMNLLGVTTASHIHCCVAPPGTAPVATTVPTFAGFPLGVSSGIYDVVLDLTAASSYNPAFITAHGGTVAGAESALVAGILSGQSYLNVHTNLFPRGEIRGFLVVPEPATLALIGAALAAAAWSRRRRRSA